MIYSHYHCLSTDSHNLLPGLSIPSPSNFSYKLMLGYYFFEKENMTTYFFNFLNLNVLLIKLQVWKLQLEKLCYHLKHILSQILYMLGLRGLLIHPGSFFGRHYRIEKMAKDGILENISEENKGGKKENLVGESWGYATDLPNDFVGQITNHLYFETLLSELLAEVTHLACDVGRTTAQIIDNYAGIPHTLPLSSSNSP